MTVSGEREKDRERERERGGGGGGGICTNLSVQQRNDEFQIWWWVEDCDPLQSICDISEC